MSEPIDVRIGNLARRLKPDQTMTMPASQVLAMLAALEHAERALAQVRAEWKDSDEQFQHLYAQRVDEMNKAEADARDLRTRLAKAESERDHASMQAGINADLVHQAEQRGRADMLKRLEDMELTALSPIGPLWDIGWTAAIRTLKQALTPAALSAPPPGAPPAA